MKFFKLFGIGIKNYWIGLKFLIRQKLYWFIIFPVILFVGVYLLGHYFDATSESMTDDLKTKFTEIKTIHGLIIKTLKIIFFEQMHFLFTKFTMYFVIMCLAPVLAVISERIELVLTGNSYKWSLIQILKDIKRAFVLNIRLILIEYSLILVFLGVGTLVGPPAKWWIAYAVPFVIGFYFYGFGFIDYVLERRRLDIRQTFHFVSRHKGLAFALGSVYASLFLSFAYLWRIYPTLPSDNTSQILWGTLLVISFLLAVTAPLLAITSATISMHEIINLSNNEYASKKTDEKMESDKIEDHDNDVESN